MSLSRPQSLLIRAPNWLGDCVMLYPVLDVLSGSGFGLHIVGPGWINAVYERSDWRYDGVLSGIWQHSRQLKAYSEHAMFIFTNSFSSALAGALAGKRTVGYRTDGRSFLLSKAIIKPPGLHEVEYFSNLAQAGALLFNAEADWPRTALAECRLPVMDKAYQEAKQLHEYYHIGERYWMLCPSAVGKGSTGASKVWPYWPQLSMALNRQGICCVMCPGKDDVSLDLPGVICLSNVNLSLYKALLAKATGVIANDTGPMHLAAAVGAPTLGLFGVSDPQRTRPWQGHFLGGVNGWPSLDTVLDFVAKFAG